MTKKEDSTSLEHHSPDPWQQLKTLTRARIAIGRVGSSLPTKEVLDFGLSHAMARDAVHLALDVDALENDIKSIGYETIRVHSKAVDRATYLLRPDWGRRLNEQSIAALKNIKHAKPIDFLIVVGDGLSSLAVSRHVAPMLAEIKNACANDAQLNEWSASRVVIASQARVAIGDEIGEILNAKMVVMLIGERPGLSSPDSLGLYLTHAPKVGLSDADRNCISNVRPEGLQYATAAKKLMWLAKEAMRLKVTGVALKDESDVQEIENVKSLK
jgi:ethanolamine ammonia-lyase small subunit